MRPRQALRTRLSRRSDYRNAVRRRGVHYVAQYGNTRSIRETGMSNEHRQLLALCLACSGSDWHVIAREAQRPGGLDRLLAGEVSETTRQARAARAALSKGL